MMRDKKYFIRKNKKIENAEKFFFKKREKIKI